MFVRSPNHTERCFICSYIIYVSYLIWLVQLVTIFVWLRTFFPFRVIFIDNLSRFFLDLGDTYLHVRYGSWSSWSKSSTWISSCPSYCTSWSWSNYSRRYLLLWILILSLIYIFCIHCLALFIELSYYECLFIGCFVDILCYVVELITLEQGW